MKTFLIEGIGKFLVSITSMMGFPGVTRSVQVILWPTVHLNLEVVIEFLVDSRSSIYPYFCGLVFIDQNVETGGFRIEIRV